MYKINLIGDIGENDKVNYALLESELKNANGEDLEIIINTPGGCVDTAFKMYDLLENYKKENKAIVTTITDQMCASSGIILLLAGNRRIVNNNTEPFIHQAFVNFTEDGKANANELINLGFDLENVNYKIASLYAHKTALDYDLARELMNIETFFTPEEAYNLGFATELSKVYNKIDLSPRLIIQNKLERKTNINMTNEEKSLFEEIRNFFSKKDSKKSEIKNKIELSVADVEVDFTDLDADSTPAVGDKALVDGKPANGEYLMKNGNKYEFEDGVLKEIKKEEETEEESVLVDELQNQLNEANLTIETQNKSIQDLTTSLNQLKEVNKTNLEKIEKFNKLKSSFEAFEKKNKQKSDNKKEESGIDFSESKKRLNNLKK